MTYLSNPYFLRTFVRSSNVIVNNSSITLTPATGTMLVAIGFAFTGVNTVAGWTEITDAQHNPTVLDSYIRAAWLPVSSGGAATLTPFTGGSSGGIAVFEVDGLSATWTSTYDTASSSSPAPGGTTTSITGTTTHTNTLFLAAGFAQTSSFDPGAATLTTNTGAIISIGTTHGGQVGLGAGYEVIGSSGTSVTITSTTAAGNEAMAVIRVLPT